MKHPLLHRLALVLFFSAAVAGNLTAEIIHHPAHDIYLDPPEGWSFYGDVSDEKWALGDPSQTVIFNFRFVADVAADKALASVKTRLKASGPELAFSWNGLTAHMGNWQFKADGQPQSSWILAAPVTAGTALFLVFCPTAREDQFSDQMLSALGSVALGEAGRRQPGPMTAFYLATDPKQQSLDVKLDLPGDKPGATTWTTTAAANESERLVIDRESRLMPAYLGKAAAVAAWQRYYRQIFREMAGRTGGLVQAWQGWLKAHPDQRPETAVLAWLQGLAYDRKAGISDISTSFETLNERRGDCDSKALLYSAVLQGLGVPAILMVSPKFSHALAAVDVAGPGARFDFAGKPWLVAELTKKVALGQIAADMADPAAWIGIDLLGQP